MKRFRVFRLSDILKETEPTPAGESPQNGSLATPIGSVSTDIISEIDDDVNGKLSLSEAAERKAQQLAIILENNPMWDDYHTGIRSVEDIRTLEEVLELDDAREGQFVWGDSSREDAENALENNSITVYSSHPISNGIFVSTSYIQAWEYAGGRGNSKVYSKEVPLDDVAWINGDEGQYARVPHNQSVAYSISGKNQAAMWGEISRTTIRICELSEWDKHPLFYKNDEIL